jgi:hypothetical protein
MLVEGYLLTVLEYRLLKRVYGTKRGKNRRLKNYVVRSFKMFILYQILLG